MGIRAVLVPYVAEHPDHDYFETLKTNEALIQKWHKGADGRVQVWVGLEHMFYATTDAWKRAIEIAREKGAQNISLTSNPIREAANRLYLRVGFKKRETNAYQMKL